MPMFSCGRSLISFAWMTKAFSKRDPSRRSLRTVSVGVLAGVLIAAVGINAADASDPVRPGTSFVMEFPHLRPDRRGDMARMRVRIPDTYSSNRQVPLFVWLGGGNGTSNYGAGARIADPETFVLIGLPYPEGADDRRQSTMVGDFRRIWAYHTAMLKELANRVPNIDPERIYVGGFSNGAHCIDGYLKMDEPTQFFSAFVMAEGGGYRSGRYCRAAQGKRVLVLWGDSSPHRSTGFRLSSRLAGARMDVTRIQMRGTRHQFPATYQERAHDWLLR